MILPSLEILTAPEAPARALGLGILLHIFFFRFGEWDLATLKLIVGFTATTVSLCVAIVLTVPEFGNNVWAAFKTSITLNYAVLSGIYASMLVYRAAFRRLKISRAVRCAPVKSVDHWQVHWKPGQVPRYPRASQKIWRCRPDW